MFGERGVREVESMILQWRFIRPLSNVESYTSRGSLLGKTGYDFFVFSDSNTQSQFTRIIFYCLSICYNTYISKLSDQVARKRCIVSQPHINALFLTILIPGTLLQR